jgi:hypothetical protein
MLRKGRVDESATLLDTSSHHRRQREENILSSVIKPWRTPSSDYVFHVVTLSESYNLHLVSTKKKGKFS